MTRDETIKTLMVIQAAYPNYKPPDKTVTVNIWTEMLSDVSYEQVSVAVKAYIQTDTSGFAPGIGAIREKIAEMFSQENGTDAEAWQVVWKAIRCSGDYDRAIENFNSFPTTIQKAVGSPNQLREWALTQKLNVEVVSSNFRKTFRMEQQRERERSRLSPDVLKLMRPLNNPQIEDKPKELSVEEQRMISEAHSSPAPEGFSEIVRRRLYEQQTKDKGKTV